MSVLKNAIVSIIFFVNLFAVDLYLPKDFKVKIDNILIHTKYYSSLNTIDINNSFILVSYNNIPFILDNNLTILLPVGNINEYILTYKRGLSNIKTISKLDFASRILLDEFDKDYQIKNATLKDFLEKKVDAIVSDKLIEGKGIYYFPLKSFGIEFNKYFIVAKRDFINENRDLIEAYSDILKQYFKVNDNLVYKTLLVSGLYLNKKINLSKILVKNYMVEKENNQEIFIVGVTGKWPPFNMYENGKFYGIGVDFFKLIAKKANIKYLFKKEDSWDQVLEDIKKRKIDITPSTSETPDRKKYALFSKPYISFPLAIICKGDDDVGAIDKIKSIAVGKNFTAEKLMKKYYPNLNYIETKDVLEALNLVEKNKAECAVDILPVMLWNINKNNFMDLKISFKTPFKFHVQVMVRNDYPELLKKINSAIDKITPQEREKILNTYLKSIIIETNNSVNRTLIFVGIGIIFVFGVILWKNREKLKQFQKDALFDELTQILNRRGVYKKIKEINKGSILFFDIDHFKKINDTYGHDFGDYVLKEIGKILKNTFRKSDIVGRWGGEEFIVILPNTNYEDGLKLAEKLRKIIENYDFQGKKVTISIGVSEYNGNLEEVLKKVDEALYEAKRNGRNQVKGKR